MKYLHSVCSLQGDPLIWWQKMTPCVQRELYSYRAHSPPGGCEELRHLIPTLASPVPHVQSTNSDAATHTITQNTWWHAAMDTHSHTELHNTYTNTQWQPHTHEHTLRRGGQAKALPQVQHSWLVSQWTYDHFPPSGHLTGFPLPLLHILITVLRALVSTC